MTSIVLLFPDLTVSESSIGFAVIQGVYMCIHFAIRPQKHMKDQLLEIINEMVYSGLIVCVYVWRKKSDWSDLKISIFLWTMIANAILFVTISFGNFNSMRFSFYRWHINQEMLHQTKEQE